MKHYLLLFIPLIFNSCRTYQYTTLESKNMQKNERSILMDENDTTRIEYHFNNSYRTFTIQVFNKTNEPLYADWQKSAMIINDKATSYFDPNSQINGSFRSESLQWTNDLSSQQGTINATVHIQPGMNFIPPQSYIQYKPSVSLPDMYLSKDKFRILKIRIGKTKYKIKRADFTENNTPLVFKSYITFSSGTGGGKSFSRLHEFYVGSAVKTPLYAEKLYNKNIPGNVSTTSHLTGFGSAATVIVTTGILAVAIAGSLADDSQQRQ